MFPFRTLIGVVALKLIGRTDFRLLLKSPTDRDIVVPLVGGVGFVPRRRPSAWSWT
jgi:hypothetical protein